MNLKKILLSFVTIATFAIFVLAQGAVYAKEINPPVTMGLSRLMLKNEPNTGYAIDDLDRSRWYYHMGFCKIFTTR